MIDIEKLEKWHFEITREACNYLLDLVLQGQKKATSSAEKAFEIKGEKIPEVGDLSVITDWDENCKCVVKTKRIIILPFKEITFEIVKLEGEDESLQSWQENHKKFFMAEGKELGYEFSEDMEVVFEEFEVVEKL